VWKVRKGCEKVVLSFWKHSLSGRMSQLQNGGVINHGEQRSESDEEEDDVFAEDFEAAYSRAQKEFTREVRRKQMLWLIWGLIFGSFVTLAISLPIAFLTAPSDTIPGSNQTKTTSTTPIETTETSSTKRPTTGTNMPATKTLATSAHQDEDVDQEDLWSRPAMELRELF